MEQTGIKIHKVWANQLHAVWPTARKYLIAAIEKSNEQDRCDIEMLLIDIANNNAQLLIATKNNKIVAAVVLVVCEQYNGVSVCIYLMGGIDMHEWIEQMHESIVEYARSIGAKWIDTCTRPAMGEILMSNFGYKQKTVFYTLGV
jgi:hypothetical protein